MNNQVRESNHHDKDVIDDSECIDKTDHYEEDNISKDLEPPNSLFPMDKSIAPYVPRVPFPQRLVKQTKHGDSFNDTMELFKKVQINIPLLNAIKHVLNMPSF